MMEKKTQAICRKFSLTMITAAVSVTGFAGSQKVCTLDCDHVIPFVEGLILKSAIIETSV